MNANILTSGAGHEKWQQAHAKVLGNPPTNETNARFNRAMLTFIQKCGATSKTLFVTLKKCVPAWQKKYTDSNACKNIDNVNDLADYYGDLENQEKKEHNQDNQHRDRNSTQG